MLASFMRSIPKSSSTGRSYTAGEHDLTLSMHRSERRRHRVRLVADGLDDGVPAESLGYLGAQPFEILVRLRDVPDASLEREAPMEVMPCGDRHASRPGAHRRRRGRETDRAPSR